MIKKLVTETAEETEKIGRTLGKALRGGEVIELVSDLGGGKTTFTRGFVAGSGSDDLVSSPTFTISNSYDSGPLTINHFDFYRLPEAGLMEHELEDIIGEPDQVVIVEWSDVVAHVLPDERITISLQALADDQREITITYPEKLTYLVEAI